tara:strand:+ start:6426 stop:7094 length:669 start_codon:yes stop_codon:yes gene_type:complete
MGLQRSNAELLSEVRSRVRLEVNDSDAASYRWSNTEVDRAIFDSVRYLIREKSNRDPGELLQYHDISYTGLWHNLGSTIGSASIIKVELINDVDHPQLIEYVPISVLEVMKAEYWTTPIKIYSLASNGTERQIGIRSADDNTAVEIRVWYLSEAITPAVDGDSMPLQPTWSRLVQLHAAKALRSIEGEWTVQQESNLREMIELWKSHRQAGGFRVVPTRRRY